jgi:hypothetical protein
MRKYRAVFAAGVGISWDLKETFNVENGMETVSAEEWARQSLGKGKEQRGLKRQRSVVVSAEQLIRIGSVL